MIYTTASVNLDTLALLLGSSHVVYATDPRIQVSLDPCEMWPDSSLGLVLLSLQVYSHRTSVYSVLLVLISLEPRQRQSHHISQIWCLLSIETQDVYFMWLSAEFDLLSRQRGGRFTRDIKCLHWEHQHDLIFQTTRTFVTSKQHLSGLRVNTTNC